MPEHAEPILDAPQIADLRALDKGQGAIYAGFVEMFLSGAPVRIARLKALAAASDAAALAAAAHALRGSAGNVGALRLSVLFHRIEQAAQGANPAEAAALIGTLDEAYAAARDALLGATGKS